MLFKSSPDHFNFKNLFSHSNSPNKHFSPPIIQDNRKMSDDKNFNLKLYATTASSVEKISYPLNNRIFN
jgi:hypothetical protein